MTRTTTRARAGPTDLSTTRKMAIDQGTTPAYIHGAALFYNHPITPGNDAAPA